MCLYELLGKAPADPDLERFLQLYHQGLQLLRQSQWEDSAQAFASASRLRPQDHHSHRYLLLAQQYQADPPVRNGRDSQSCGKCREKFAEVSWEEGARGRPLCPLSQPPRAFWLTSRGHKPRLASPLCGLGGAWGEGRDLRYLALSPKISIVS